MTPSKTASDTPAGEGPRDLPSFAVRLVIELDDNPTERDAIRREADPPLKPNAPGMYVDFTCSQLIAKCLRRKHV